jgi:hypothetical protein
MIEPPITSDAVDRLPASHSLRGIGAGVYLTLVLLLVNLQPYPLFESYDDDYHHGWPFTYMIRDGTFPNNNMTSREYAPWPFFDTPPLQRFSTAWLAIDAFVGIALVALTAGPIGNWIGSRGSKLRIAVLAWIVCTAGVWCLIACNSPLVKAANVPLLHNSIIAWAIFITDYLVPFLALAVISFLAIRRLTIWWLQPKVSPPWITLMLGEAVLCFLFFCFVVNDWLQLGRPWPMLSMLFVITFSLVGALGLGKYLLATLSQAKHNSSQCNDNVMKQQTVTSTMPHFRLASTVYLITFVVGWTTIYVSYFDLTTFHFGHNGQSSSLMLDAYGWPWEYRASYSESPEQRAAAKEEGYPIDLFYGKALVADFLTTAFIISGTFIQLGQLLQLPKWRFHFSLRTLLLLFVAISLAVYLPSVGGCDLLWPNWFVRAVLVAGIAAATLGLSNAALQRAAAII